MSKKNQNIIFAAIIIVIAVIIMIFGFFRQSGGYALVSVADKQPTRLSLSKNGVYPIDGGQLPVQIEIKDGKASFVNSQCPDHVCESFGWLYKEDDKATCAPARVVLSIE